MNICFFIGRIVSEIDFRFALSSENYSRSIFTLKLLDDTSLIINCYNYVADYSYRNLKKNDFICCEAILENNKIVAKYINVNKCKSIL